MPAYTEEDPDLTEGMQDLDGDGDLDPVPDENEGATAAQSAASQRVDRSGQPLHTRVAPGGREMEGGRYVPQSREDKIKSMLNPYLEERAKERMAIYGNEGTKRRLQDAVDVEKGARERALIASLSQDSAGVGTLHGVTPKTSMPQWAQDTDDAAWKGYAARQGLVNQNEAALRTDLDIGRTVYEGEMEEKKRKDNTRDKDLDRQYLYDQLQAKAEGKLPGRGGQWSLSDVDINGQPAMIDRTTGKTMPLPGAKRAYKPGPENTPNYSPVEGATGPNGEVVSRDPRTGRTRLETLPAGTKRKATPPPRTPRGPNAKVVDDINSNVVKQEMIADTLTAELAKYQQLLSEGKKDQARKHGEGMLKGINSQFGPDAIGTQEADRIGGFLQPLKSPFAAGSTFKVDYDMFADQVQAKIESIRAAAAMQQKKADGLRAKDAASGFGTGGGGGGANVDEMTEEEIEAAGRERGLW